MKIGSFPASSAGNGLSAFVGYGNAGSCSPKEPSGYRGCQHRMIYPPSSGNSVVCCRAWKHAIRTFPLTYVRSEHDIRHSLLATNCMAGMSMTPADDPRKPATFRKDAMEHVARCKVERCCWSESWTTKEAAESAAAWHVWADHRDVWVHTIGEDRPPNHPPPDWYGSNLEEWESQR